jgi:hypothetical protein
MALATERDVASASAHPLAHARALSVALASLREAT